MPVTYYVFIDTNNDGELDYAVWNGMADDDAKMQTIVTSLATYERSAKYFAEHATNTANTVLRICGDQIGLNLYEHIVQSKRPELFIEVEAYDYLYGGPGDVLANLTIVPFGECDRIPCLSCGFDRCVTIIISSVYLRACADSPIISP